MYDIELLEKVVGSIWTSLILSAWTRSTTRGGTRTGRLWTGWRRARDARKVPRRLSGKIIKVTIVIKGITVLQN